MRTSTLGHNRSQRTVVILLGIGIAALVLVTGFLSVRAGQAGAAPAVTGNSSIYARIIDVNNNPIHGDVRARGFENQIQIDSTNLGVTTTVQIGSAGTGEGAGKAQQSPITFTAPAGSDSPSLFLALARGAPLRSATFSFVRSSGAGTIVYQSYTLTECLLSSFQQATHTPQGPEDTFQMECVKWKYSFQPIGANGLPSGGPIIATWDFSQNKPF
jgi:type VI secretion system Hcp family effector